MRNQKLEHGDMDEEWTTDYTDWELGPLAFGFFCLPDSTRIYSEVSFFSFSQLAFRSILTRLTGFQVNLVLCRRDLP